MRRMTMYDGGKIISGLVIFVILVLSPFWYNALAGNPGYKPNPELPKTEKACVESKAFMKAEHMTLLDDWRDSVVRDKNRVYIAKDGKKHNMSLSNNCMNCHSDKEKFCDQCHNYLGVSPYCWDCHIEPQKD
jgi:hypothetical protein